MTGTGPVQSLRALTKSESIVPNADRCDIQQLRNNLKVFKLFLDWTSRQQPFSSLLVFEPKSMSAAFVCD